ncbi:hypothetical protein D9M70_622530 [compost metagenome]
MAHGPGNRRTQVTIEARVEDVVMVSGVAPLLQEHVAEPGGEIDRNEPGDDQRDADHIKQ